MQTFQTVDDILDKLLLSLYRMGDVSIEQLQFRFLHTDVSKFTSLLETEGLIAATNAQRTGFRITPFGESIVSKYNNYSTYKKIPTEFPNIGNFKYHLLSYLEKNTATFLPLAYIINQYAPQYPDENEADERRQAITNMLKDMVKDDFIEIQGSDYLYLTQSSYDQNKKMRVYSYNAVNARITDKGRKELKNGKINLPMLGLINEEVETGDISVDERINHAKALFFSEPKTIHNLRSACEGLSFVLEPLRSNNELKQFFIDKDVSDFFNIVNNFDIRHNKTNTQKIVHIEQLEWVFYSLLNTINTYYKLIQKSIST